MKKIDVSKIENYASMTAEEKLAALESYEYDDFTDALTKAQAEVDRYKNALTKSNADAKQWKDKHNALLSDEEKAKAKTAEEFESMKAELTELREGKAISEYATQYVAMGYDKDLAYETATAQAKGDFQKMMQNHNAFLANQKKIIEAEALKKQPDLSAGTPPTKEQLENAELDSIFKAAGI